MTSPTMAPDQGSRPSPAAEPVCAPDDPGCAGQLIPPDALSLADYERLARTRLPEDLFAHIQSGAGQEMTLRANREAFEAVRIWPRLLSDFADAGAQARLLGRTFAHPIGLAPVAQQGLVHREAEAATARGAGAMDALMVASTLSSQSLETIASASEGEKWFQLYFQPDWGHTLDLVRRAEASGYRALVVTLDAPIQPLSLRALRAGYRPAAGGFANLAGYEPGASRISRGAGILDGLMAGAPTLGDLERLLAQTSLPVIAKGVLHPDDAARLVGAGCAGIIVSNHGGRTLDGAPGALSCLGEIRKRLGGEVTLLMDGAVRSGRDVFIALATGADAVLLGRPQLHALSVAGDLGVAHMLRLIREELEVCMALAGCPRLEDITPACLVPASPPIFTHRPA